MSDRKILGIRDPNWLESRGRIIYDPPRQGMKRKTKHWCVMDVDREITRYFRYWVDRSLLNLTGIEGYGLKPPSWDAHVSIVRGENDVKDCPPGVFEREWRRYHGEVIPFRYSLNVRQTGVNSKDRPSHYWFVDIQSDALIQIRKDLGLPHNWGLHLTIGRTYD